MTWKSHHRRGDVLREVIRTADERLDGRLPLDVDGVADTFGDDGVRYDLQREVPIDRDDDVTYDGFEPRYNSDVDNDLV